MGGSAEIVMPKLGLTMTEGLIASWCVAPGDEVKPGDILFVVETEKVANDIAAEAAGRIGKILVAEGETAPVGMAVATWSSGAGPATESTPKPTQEPARIVATPLARKQARAHDVDLSVVAGSGPNGRIKAADVAAAIASTPRSDVAAPAARAVARPEPSTPARAGERRRPATAIEKVAARRLAESKRDTPHFYVLAEADVSGLLEFRDKMNREAKGARLSLTHFVLAVVARALDEAPECNSAWRDGDIALFDRIDIGLAVDTPRGLLAPVMRGVDRLGLDALATTAMRLVQAAREGRVGLDDMEGGAITVSNVGMFGVSRLVPIINPGQSAILGVGAVRPAFRPDETGAPKLCQELALVLSADHRVWDGVRAARFLDSIVRLLENPLRLLR